MKTQVIQEMITKDPYDKDPFTTKHKGTQAATGQRDNKLKAVIPTGVLAFLNLKNGSVLDWAMDVDSEGKRIAVIRKIEEIPEDKSLEIYEKNLSSSEQVEKALEEWIRTHKKPLGMR